MDASYESHWDIKVWKKKKNLHNFLAQKKSIKGPYNKIIFKCMNSIMRSIFNEKIIEK